MNSTIQRLYNNEVQSGLLALAPFFLLTSSFTIGITISLVAAIQLLILTTILYCLRYLIPSQQRLASILIISISVVLVDRMLLNAEAYLVAESIGLLFPLLIINSLVLSLGENIFSRQDFKSTLNHTLGISVAVIIFFVIFGFLKELFEEFSIITSPAGCFFISGFLFAAINFLKHDKATD
jgi:Na+-translocating ferredoxin:NAD+ oxidoreductase RnfE subunit